MRRTKTALIYRRTKNLRAVQRRLGHTKLENIVRYLEIEVDDAFKIARAQGGLEEMAKDGASRPKADSV